MVTRSQVGKLASRIDGLTSALGVDQEIKVTVFYGETEAFAMERHRALRPEHAGRLVTFVYDRNNERTEGLEHYVVALSTDEDWAAFQARERERDILDLNADADEQRAREMGER